MKTISYIPSKDELLVKFRSVRSSQAKKLGRFTLWWDDEGTICAIDIMPFTEELEEFKKSLNTIRLGGIWKGVKITDKEIKKTREELLQKLEDQW